MSKETFTWTDELVKEFAHHVFQHGILAKYEIDKFKQSKMPKKDKDYEVIEIENKVGGKIRKTRDDKSWYECFSLRNFDGFKINAVKRLSDGEVFSVGEEVKWAHHEPFKIIKFRIGLMEEMFSVDSADLSYDINELTKLPPPKEQSKPEQPKKERIEINGLHDHGDGVSANNGEPYRTYSFNSPRVIPTFKHRYIKEAIEKELNDETDCRVSEATLKAIRKAEKEAFYAAKAWGPQLDKYERSKAVLPSCHELYKTFDDYLNHKSKHDK